MPHAFIGRSCSHSPVSTVVPSDTTEPRRLPRYTSQPSLMADSGRLAVGMVSSCTFVVATITLYDYTLSNLSFLCEIHVHV